MKIQIFKKSKTRLHNGKEVKEGDKVYFINSDRKRIEGTIQRRQSDCRHAETGELLKKGTLFFWNNTFNPSDYMSADIIT